MNDASAKIVRNTLMLAALSALLGFLVIVGTRSAAADPGFYVSARAGVSLAASGGVPQPSSVILDWKTKTGPAYAATLGYAFEKPFRTEFEVAYQQNSLSGTYEERIQLRIFPPCGQPNRPCIGPQASGRVATPSFMAMGHYDFRLAERWRLSVGAGLGLAVYNLKIHARGTYLDNTSRIVDLVDSANTIFSGRGVVQLGYQLGRTEIVGGYSYTRSANTNMEGVGNYAFGFRQHMSRHAVEVGVRYRL